APVIYQEITGLNPTQEYDVYVAYWSNSGNWAIRAGSSPVEGANPIFDRTGDVGTRGIPAAYAAFDVLPKDNYSSQDNDGAGVLTQEQNSVTMEGDRYMLLGKAGTFTPDGSGTVRVYIDDVSDVHNQRSFFDGLAYVPK